MKAALISEYSNTQLVTAITETFVRQLTKHGITLSHFDIESMNIEPCEGCTGDYLFETNGKCRKDDDMNKIYPGLKDCDTWLFSFPIVSGKMPEPLRNFIDRLEPLFKFELNSKEHEMNRDHKGNLAVIAGIDGSSNGLEEMEFHFAQLAAMYDKKFSGIMAIPNSGALELMYRYGNKLPVLFDAAEESGRQFANIRDINPALIEALKIDIIEDGTFLKEVGEVNSVKGKY